MVLQDMNRKGHIADNKRRRREIICLKNDAEQLSGLGYTLSSLQAGIKLTDRKTITGSPLWNEYAKTIFICQGISYAPFC